LAEELSSDETVQYIRYLEVEQDRLHQQIKEVSNQLAHSKVANASLQRKLANAGSTPGRFPAE
jgi:hypothetical protein